MLARYANVPPARLETILRPLDAARILRRIAGRGGGPLRYEIFHDVLALGLQNTTINTAIIVPRTDT